MRGWSLVSGRRALVALVVALLAGVSLSAGSAYASKTMTQRPILQSDIGFFCGRSFAQPGFGSAQFNQNGSALAVKFDLVNVPPNVNVNVEVTECFTNNAFDTFTLGTVRTNSKGEAKGSFTTTLEPGIGKYLLCLDAGFPNEWGTDTVPVS